MAIKSYGKKKTNEFKYEVIETFGKLSEGDKYVKELRLISWNGADPKYDIRPWSVDENGNEKSGKGITFNAEELDNLLLILKQMDTDTE